MTSPSFDDAPGFFSSLIKSISDLSFYRLAAGYPAARSTGYLLRLTLLVTVVLSVIYTARLFSFLDHDLRELTDRLPTITIRGGQASVEVEQPFIIAFEDEDAFLIIDTTGETTTLEGRPDTQALLTRSQLIFRKSEIETRVFDLDQIEELVVDRAFITEMVRWSKIIAVPFICVFLLLYKLCALLLTALAASLVGLMVNGIKQGGLPYRALYNIAAFGITAAVLCDIILTAAVPEITGRIALYLYLVLATVLTGLATRRTIALLRGDRSAA